MATATLKELRLIAFRVGDETFVVDIMAVRQIVPYRGTTSVPTAPDFIDGIVVIRNEVVPVIDLRRRFEVEAAAPEHPLILIAETNAGTIGLKIDDVQTIVNVTADALLPPPEIVRGVRGELLIAVIPQGDEVYLLIDIESVLTAEEQSALQSADLSSSSSSSSSPPPPETGTSER